jgi:hypothetical protein
MALANCLLERGGDADRQVAGNLFRANPLGGKGEHVGSFVFAAKLAIEAANGRIGGQLYGNLAA